MATAMVCFDDMEDRREPGMIAQKHCILICNSLPYSMPVFECYAYENKNVEQLAAIYLEVCISNNVC